MACAQNAASIGALFPDGITVRRRWLMWLIAGYFDESYDDETHGKCYTVAGFLGNQLAMTALALRWKDLNEKWDIEYFKASELNAGQGQFKKYRDDPNARDWRPFSEREKSLFKEIKQNYTDLIVQSNIYGVGACLVIPDYERLKAENHPRKKYLMHPYHQCAHLALMEAGMQMHEENLLAKPDDVLFLKPIFDSHEEHSKHMKHAFDVFREKNPTSSHFLMPPDYEDEITHRALQAADNLAYESHRYLLYRHFNNPLQPRIAMSRLLNAGRVLRLYKLDYDSLKMLIENQSEDHIPISPITVAFSEVAASDVGVQPNDG